MDGFWASIPHEVLLQIRGYRFRMRELYALGLWHADLVGYLSPMNEKRPKTAGAIRDLMPDFEV